MTLFLIFQFLLDMKPSESQALKEKVIKRQIIWTMMS